MRGLFTAIVGLAALSFSAPVGAMPAAIPSGPAPVLYQAVRGGTAFPVVAKDGDRYFPVFYTDGSQPFFTDESGRNRLVSDGTGGGPYPLYYLSGNAGPQALPAGGSDAQARDVLVSGGAGASDRLVCWDGYGWYDYSWAPYSGYSYYPYYSYGYDYGGGSPYYGYYGGDYGGYYGGYGYYSYGSPYAYSGYGCVINGWYGWW
jgi:hypothetical protein